MLNTNLRALIRGVKKQRTVDIQTVPDYGTRTSKESRDLLRNRGDFGHRNKRTSSAGTAPDESIMTKSVAKYVY